MRLCERPTPWLPQNPLSFIINKLLLIIQAALYAMHVLYIWREGEREEKETAAGGGEKNRKRDSEEEKWLE